MTTDVKVSDLPVAAPLADTDTALIVQNKTSRQATFGQMKDFLGTPEYTRGPEGTPRKLRDLRRDWTTLYEQGAACDGVTNDWPALRRALLSGLIVDLERYTYRIDPDGFYGAGSRSRPRRP